MAAAEHNNEFGIKRIGRVGQEFVLFSIRCSVLGGRRTCRESSGRESDGKGEFALNQISGSISSYELDAFVRRVLREEIARLLHSPFSSILQDQSQQGPDDPAGDELLLREALAVLQEYGDKPEAWMDWEDLEAELDRME